MKISKIYLSVCSLLFACFLVCGSILRPVVTYASPYDLMISTDSNARTFAMPRSSVGTVKNTVAWDKGAVLYARLNDGSVRSLTNYITKSDSEGLSVKYSAPSGYQINAVLIYLRYGAFNYMPSIGTYNMSFDVSSQFGHSYSAPTLASIKRSPNVADIQNSYYLRPENWTSLSGDLYAHDVIVHYTGSQYVNLNLVFQELYSNLDFTLHVNFTESTASPMYTTAGTGSANSDYQEGINSSLSDLSSSVDSMTEDLSSAAENLEYISTSQNLIIQGIDNVVMHISDQLFAFWNQLFNLIHVPTMDKMDDIIDAINNMDLEIEVNLDGLKTTINNMSTAVQNKLQSTTDQITGGYDNSGLESDKSELDGVLNQYEQAEEDLFDDAKGNINDFEFDTPLEQFTGPLSDVSYFLSGLFEAMGPMNVIITFSLTLTIAMVMIGWYRFKGGR